MNFELTPFEGTTNRFQEFKQMVQRFYQWKWNQECPWDGSEASQLSRFLKSTPNLDVRDFARWLYNYAQSGDITPGERPRKFLPRIHNYSVKPIDRFGKDPDAEAGKTFAARDEAATDQAIRRARENRCRALTDGHSNKPGPHGAHGGDVASGPRRLSR